MKIEQVDFFYLSMPEVTTAGDGSQDALLVRVAAGEPVGWGECEASPLVSIAAFVCPMSHGACRPVSASVLGQTIDDPADIARIAATIELDSMDLLQAAHTWSGIEMALVGSARESARRAGLEAARLRAGREEDCPTRRSSSATRRRRRWSARVKARSDGYRAAKFGWGPIGRGSVARRRRSVQCGARGPGAGRHAAHRRRPDLGRGRRARVNAAARRSKRSARSGWRSRSTPAPTRPTARLPRAARKVKLAGGEGAHNFHMARNLIDYGGIGFVQIDCGRIGGIGPAKRVADYAVAKGVTYVNHTFTSHLALSASIQPYAGLADHRICEYPVAPKPVAWEMTRNHLDPRRKRRDRRARRARPWHRDQRRGDPEIRRGRRAEGERRDDIPVASAVVADLITR